MFTFSPHSQRVKFTDEHLFILASFSMSRLSIFLFLSPLLLVIVYLTGRITHWCVSQLKFVSPNNWITRHFRSDEALGGSATLPSPLQPMFLDRKNRVTPSNYDFIGLVVSETPGGHPWVGLGFTFPLLTPFPSPASLARNGC